MLDFIAANTTDVFVRVDRRGIVTYASPSLRNYGYDPADIVGTTGLQLIHPEDRAHFAANLAALLTGELDEAADRQHRFLKADGGELWIEGNPTLTYNADGRPDGFVNVFRDATVRREAQIAIANSEARYRQIAEKTADIIALSDNDGKITFMSPSIRKFGFEPEDLLGQSFTPYIHPDDDANMRRSLMGQTPGGDCARLRWRARHKITGEWIWQESVPSRLWDEITGEPVGFLDVVRDISEQVAQEEALFEARAQAEAATAVKSQFLANMSHEIRTPLTAVLGFTGLLETRGLDEVSQGYVQRIAAAGSALLTIVNDILDFSKLEAGRVEIRPQPTDVGEIAREALALFATPAAAKGLELSLDLAAGIPGTVMVDPDRLRQVLVNLAGNAVKFTETGRVALSIAPAAEGSLRFAVADTGPGLDAEQCDRLFQRFNQIDGSTTRKHGGTGLGLAICKGLVEAMGGTIGVTSAPGEGSVFHMTLPCAAVATLDAAPDEDAMASIAGLAVTVVDDNPTNRELARRILEAFGARVTDAEGGAQALSLLAGAAVDVVLMDLRMPGIDGREALRRLRAQTGPNRDVPVLAFTADADIGEPAGDLGGPNGLDMFDGVIRKPINPQQLAGAIAAAAKGRGVEAGQRACG